MMNIEIRPRGLTTALTSNLPSVAGRVGMFRRSQPPFSSLTGSDGSMHRAQLCERPIGAERGHVR
jgi:hypothetical protein